MSLHTCVLTPAEVEPRLSDPSAHGLRQLEIEYQRPALASPTSHGPDPVPWGPRIRAQDLGFGFGQSRAPGLTAHMAGVGDPSKQLLLSLLACLVGIIVSPRGSFEDAMLHTSNISEERGHHRVSFQNFAGFLSAG